MARQMNKFKRPADGGGQGAFTPDVMAQSAQHALSMPATQSGLMGPGNQMPVDQGQQDGENGYSPLGPYGGRFMPGNGMAGWAGPMASPEAMAMVSQPHPVTPAPMAGHAYDPNLIAKLIAQLSPASAADLLKRRVA